MPAPEGELHGTSVFLRDGGRVFHTYSTYGRGTEQVGGTHYYLDMTALGRQEDWEEPKGRAESLGPRADVDGQRTVRGAAQAGHEAIERSRHGFVLHLPCFTRPGAGSKGRLSRT
jgi:hypothetical protein